MKHLRVMLMRLGRIPRGLAWMIGLSKAERRVLFGAARSASRVRNALKRFNVVSVIDEQIRRRSQLENIADELSAERIAHLCARAMRLFPSPPTCLPRSIAMHHELTLRDLPAEIRIGAKLEDNGLRFHAWVVSGDTVLMEDPAELDGFAPFDLEATMLGTRFS